MISASTNILGLIGWPVEHSISPQLHNSIIKNNDLDYIYLGFPVKKNDLSKAISGIRAMGIRGVNVTIPHKRDVIKYLDHISYWAEKIGAVNTIKNENGKLTGYNTDGIGFQKMLIEDNKVELTGEKVLVIGAGGAAHAVGAVCCESEVDKLIIANRTKNKAELLAKKYYNIYSTTGVNLETFSLSELSKSDMLEIDIIIDTTPVGMSPKTDVNPVIPPSYITSDMTVVDLVYSPLETVLLEEAQKKGAKTINGLAMLLHQAAESFYIWTGFKPEVEEYKNVLKNISLEDNNC